MTSTSAQQALRAHLEDVLAVQRQCQQRPAPAMAMPIPRPRSLCLSHGKWFLPRTLPRDVRRGAPKQCFANAIIIAAHRGWRYVEGYALAVIPVQHAWVLDHRGRLCEVTWPTPGRAYLGVEFAVERADDATWTGDASVLDDYKRRWPCCASPGVARTPCGSGRTAPGWSWSRTARSRRRPPGCGGIASIRRTKMARPPGPLDLAAVPDPRLSALGKHGYCCWMCESDGRYGSVSSDPRDHSDHCAANQERMRHGGPTERKPRPKTTRRPCLRCDRPFKSEGNHHRLCPDCRALLEKHRRRRPRRARPACGRCGSSRRKRPSAACPLPLLALRDTHLALHGAAAPVRMEIPVAWGRASNRVCARESRW